MRLYLFAKEEIWADSEHLEIDGLSSPFYIREDGVEIKRFQRSDKFSKIYYHREVLVTFG